MITDVILFKRRIRNGYGMICARFTIRTKESAIREDFVAKEVMDYHFLNKEKSFKLSMNKGFKDDRIHQLKFGHNSKQQ